MTETTTEYIAIVLEPDVDLVATCVTPVPAGATLHLPGLEPLTVLGDIASGHKVALADIAEGDHVMKYGQPIGVASRPIKRGEHVHVHNLDSDRAGGAVH